MGRPPLASILVKLASTLHVAPCCKVMMALFVASSEVNVRIDPNLDLKELNAVVIVYVTPSLKVSVDIETFVQLNIATVKPDDPANVQIEVDGNSNVPDTDKRLLSVSVPVVAPSEISFHVIPLVLSVVLAAMVSVEDVVVTVPET